MTDERNLGSIELGPDATAEFVNRGDDPIMVNANGKIVRLMPGEAWPPLEPEPKPTREGWWAKLVRWWRKS